MVFDGWKGALEALPDALREETARLLARFDDACACADQSLKPPGDIVSVFAKSPYIAEYATRRPGEFLAVITAVDIDAARTREGYDEIMRAAMAGTDDDGAVMRALREVRNRESARIAWRDLTGIADVETVMAELSRFADAVLRQALDRAAHELAARFGRPALGHDPMRTLLVIAMGKLGGKELNFSSDIDLIFVYPAAGQTHGGARQLDHQDYFDRLGKRLIALLHEVTEDGFVFRVDMRLRPFGDSGPLTTSLDALEHYYAVHGRDWERYALIKARVVTGAAADREAFVQLTRPFVYRRYIDFGAVDAVREMKALIDEEISTEDLADNVKRGEGGIREIEFIGQTFQLIRGGREPALRQVSIMSALTACAGLHLLEADAVTRLQAAYLFLRQTEHRLQQVHDRQTHRLPHDPMERARLAWGMGFADWPAFAALLESHRAVVARYFGRLLAPAPGDADAGKPGGSNLADELRLFWAGSDNAESAPEIFAKAGYADPAEALAILAHLKDPRFLERLSRNEHQRLDRLMPKMIAEVGRRPRASETLGRLAELIRGVVHRSVYLSLLAEHPAALGRLVDLYAASPWIAQQITRQPILLDSLLEANALYTPPSAVDLENQLQLGLAKNDPDDLERKMEILRTFKHEQVLRVAASDVMGRFPVAEVSNQLTDIAETVLRAALHIAWADLTARHGAPRCVDAEGERNVGFAIVAYGKLGGWELGYGSDLDLVFLHDSGGARQQTDGDRVVDNGVFFTRIAQRLIHLLSTTTAAGCAYDIDVRLRPSGESGLLVASLEAFSEYQQHQAWTWEHQALVRARSVAGSKATRAGFSAIRKQVLAAPRNEQKLRDDIGDMRERMRGELDRSGAGLFDLKQGRGGITDVEFMVQYGVLRWAATHPELLGVTDNLRLLEAFAELDLLPRAHSRTLHDAYFAYRAEVHRRALQQIDNLVDESQFDSHRTAVMNVWREVFSDPVA